MITPRCPIPTALLLMLLLRQTSSPAGQDRFQPPHEWMAGTVSASTRFHVRGTNRADNIQVAAWLDEVANRAGSMLKAPLPYRPGDAMIQVILRPDTNLPRRIETAQYSSDIGFRQILRIEGVGKEDQFEALVALSRLLVIRYVAAEIGFPERAHYDFPIPDWLPLGLASAISPAARRMHRERLAIAWRTNVALPMTDVLDNRLASPWREAAHAEWFLMLASHSSAPSLFPQLFQAIGRQQTIDADWFVEYWPAVDSTRELAQMWDLRLIGLQHTILDVGALSIEDVYRLKEQLLVTPEQISVAKRRDIRETYWLGDLIEYYGAPWMPELADMLSARIQEATLGRAFELQHVASHYLHFLEHLREAPRPGRQANLTSREITLRHLERLLLEAEETLAELERRLVRHTTGDEPFTSPEEE